MAMIPPKDRLAFNGNLQQAHDPCAGNRALENRTRQDGLSSGAVAGGFIASRLATSAGFVGLPYPGGPSILLALVHCAPKGPVRTALC